MVLVRVLLIVPPPWAVVLSPPTLALLAAIHEYVEAILELNDKFNATPLHTVAVLALVIVGIGFTVTVTVCAVPGQLPVVAVGVTVYTTD